MCGISGIINFNNDKVQEESIRQMMSLMKHRGPDDEGVFMEENIGLGFVRLSIIDLGSSGHQPMVSIDNRLVIVFNGEIYNYIEIKEELIDKKYIFKTNSDTEVIINSYIEWGEDCINHFNGMFAFTIFDREKNLIFCARDRFGIKPFYYIINKDYFAFCSEIPPLLSLLKNKSKPNYKVICDFLFYNRTDHTENTFFEDIKKLQHGHKLSLNLDTYQKVEDFHISLSRWYYLKTIVSNSIGFIDQNEFRELFSSCLKLHLRSDVPIGVCLSGGLDSSSIVSVLLKEYNIKDLKTFSAIYKKGQIGDETEYINEYKKILKNMFYTIPDANSLEFDLMKFIKIHAEPMPGTSPYAQYKVMQLAKGNVVVTLDGQGADEELAGYDYFFGFYFKELLFKRQYGKLIIELYYYFINQRSFNGLKDLLFLILPNKIKLGIRYFNRRYIIKEFLKKNKFQDSLANNLDRSKDLTSSLIDHFEYKLEHLLKWEDRNSMFFSIESRVPFLDYRLVEKILASTSNKKINKGTTKYIFREAMKEILPEKIRLRKDKIGFSTPEDEWFREPKWQNFIFEILNSYKFASRNIIDPKIAINMYQKHISNKKNISKEIWKWIHLELWFREFID